MIKIILTVGIPASGKSTWAKEQILKDSNIVRINRDDIRSMMFNSSFSKENENLTILVRNNIILSSLKNKRDIIIDDCNVSKSNFNDICSLIRAINIECTVLEHPIYIDLDEAIKRNSLRQGSSYVPENVIRKMWEKLGKEKHSSYIPRIEILNKKSYIQSCYQDITLPKAVIFDNDGTLSLVHANRSPYDASTCDLDAPNNHVVEVLKLYFRAGYKVIFVSGREDKYKEPTERFYQKYFPEIKYDLFMRKTNDFRKDYLIKEEIYINNIKDKYNICAWFDDRLQVCRWIYDNGLPLFRVGDPEASF